MLNLSTYCFKYNNLKIEVYNVNANEQYSTNQASEESIRSFMNIDRQTMKQRYNQLRRTLNKSVNITSLKEEIKLHHGTINDNFKKLQIKKQSN